MSRKRRAREGSGTTKARKRTESADQPEARKIPKTALISLAVVMIVIAGAGVYLEWAKRSEDPGAAFERWLTATREGDCDVGHAMLASEVKEATFARNKEQWCIVMKKYEVLGQLSTEPPVVRGDVACIAATYSVAEDEPPVRHEFVMVRESGRWKVKLGTSGREVGIPECK